MVRTYIAPFFDFAYVLQLTFTCVSHSSIHTDTHTAFLIRHTVFRAFFSLQSHLGEHIRGDMRFSVLPKDTSTHRCTGDQTADLHLKDKHSTS